MAVTRINNNQITDASGANTQLGINANTKVQTKSITSTLLADDLTYGSNFTITGNLQVNGNTTTIDTTTLTVEDPLILLASGQTGNTPSLDIGFIGERGTQNNIALVWDEAQDTFVTAFTDSTANATTVNILSYADFKTNNLSVIGNLIAANVSFTGNVSSLTVTGNIAAGNITAETISTSGTVTSGNVATVGYVTATGNIYGDSIFSNTSISATSTITGGNLFTAGNISATGTANVGNVETSGYLTATGNITGGNLTTAGTVSANVITASGTITGGNLITAGLISTSGNIAGNNISITTDASVGGNVTAGNIATAGQITATGNITGNYFIGNGSQLTDLPAGSFIANGTSNVNIATANGNITLAVAGTADVVIVSTSGLDTTGILSAAGNVYGNNISATGTLVAQGNVTGGNVLTGGLVSSTGNITGGNVDTAGRVTATGNIQGGNLITAGLATVTGTISGGNIATDGYVSAGGNVTGLNIITTGLITATGNISTANNVNAVNVAASGNITGNNASLTGSIVVDANVSAGNVITSTITTAANTSLTIFGNTSLTLSTLGNISASSVNITDLADPVNDQDAATKAYVDAAAQGLHVLDSSNVATTSSITVLTNFTSFTYDNGSSGVGATLTIASTAQLSIDGVNLSTLVAGAGRVVIKNEVGAYVDNTTESAAFNGIYEVTSSGALLTVLTRTADFDGSPSGEIPSAYTFVTQGTANANSGWVCTNTTAPVVGTDAIVFSQFSQAGNYAAGDGLTLTGATFSVNVDNNTTAISSGNVVVKTSANLTTPNIGNATFQSLSAVGGTGNIIANNVSSVGVVSGVNFEASGNVSVTGYVSGANVFVTSLANTAVPYANSTGGLLSSATFTYDAGLLSVGNVATTGNVSSAGNVTAANFVTSGSSGNITGANIISATTFTASGNVTGGNVLTGGLISATGNVTAAYYFGDGSQLTNLSAGSSLVNGNSNVTVAANSNVTIGVTGTSNVVVISTTGLETSGNLSATGNAYVPAIVNNGTYNTQVALGAAAGIIAVTSNGNSTEFGPAGVITLGGASQIIGGTFGGSGFTAGTSQTDLFQNRGGNVTVQVGTGGTTADTWTFAQGGDLLAPGIISAVGNIAVAANAFFIGNGSQLTGLPVGSLLANGTSNVSIATANGNITMAVNGTANVVVVDSTSMTVTANITANGIVSASGNVTSNATINGDAANITNNVLAGSLSVTGNVYAGNVLFVDTSTNTASFGSSTQTTDAIVAFNATNSIVLPVGTTAQRPGVGNEVTGMVRWNTTAGAMEAYDGAEWATVGAQSFTVIQNEQFDGDGVTTAFTLTSNQTTDSCIVTINGVVQIPTASYSVSGTSLVFTEAPALGDTIDVRELTTTTTITGITSPTISLVGNVVTTLAATATTITANSAMTFSLANNTSLLVSVKGNDGTVRTATITLT